MSISWQFTHHSPGFYVSFILAIKEFDLKNRFLASFFRVKVHLLVCVFVFMHQINHVVLTKRHGRKCSRFFTESKRCCFGELLFGKFPIGKNAFYIHETIPQFMSPTLLSHMKYPARICSSIFLR